MEKDPNGESPFLPLLHSNTTSPTKCQKDNQAERKQQRLNAAMRANLKKRKAQLQARIEKETGTDSDQVASQLPQE